MMPRTTTILTTVDRKLVKVLQRIYTVIRVSPPGPPPAARSMRPGPNYLRHMSVGLLVAEAVRAWAEHSEAAVMPLVAAELETRGFNHSSQALEEVTSDSAPVAAVDDLFAANMSIDTKLHFAASLIDELAAGVDQFNPAPLSPREVVNDLIAMGAPAEAIDAYVQAVGTSDVSPSTVMDLELESNNYPVATATRASAMSPPTQEHEMTL